MATHSFSYFVVADIDHAATCNTPRRMVRSAIRPNYNKGSENTVKVNRVSFCHAAGSESNSRATLHIEMEFDTALMDYRQAIDIALRRSFHDTLSEGSTRVRIFDNEGAGVMYSVGC